MSIKKNKKLHRLYFILIILISVSMATFFILKALNEKIVFFYTPTNIVDSKKELKDYIRLGGLVLEDSIRFKKNGLDMNFTITDNQNFIDVVYSGILPDLFREEQGVVVEGNYDNKENLFYAKKVLAKHDENYMPPEVYKAIGKQLK